MTARADKEGRTLGQCQSLSWVSGSLPSNSKLWLSGYDTLERTTDTHSTVDSQALISYAERYAGHIFCCDAAESQHVSLLLLTDRGLRVLAADVLCNFFPFGEFVLSSGTTPRRLPQVFLSMALDL